MFTSVIVGGTLIAAQIVIRRVPAICTMIALSGKALSEKQLNALKKMAVKYRDQLKNPEEVF